MDQLTYHKIKLSELRKGNLAILEALNGNKKVVDIGLIEKYVSGETSMPISKIYKRTRKREIVQVRQLIHHFARKYTRKTTTEIGRECGKYNHATVLWSYKNIQNLYSFDRWVRETYDSVDKKLSKHEIR
jgi:chromosomal replication initiator protein